MKRRARADQAKALMLDIIQELIASILISLAPKRRTHYAWYMLFSIMVIVACSTCSFIVEGVIASMR